MLGRPCLVLVALALPLAAITASAAECQTATVEELGQTNFATACVLDEGVLYDDTTQRAEYRYLAHVTSTVDVDPFLTHTYVESDQNRWTYDDGDVSYERRSTNLGVGNMENVANLVGGGFQANLDQRDQDIGEAEGEGPCASWVGRSTCTMTSAWVGVNGGPSVGVGAYTQTGSGEDCQHTSQFGVSAAVTFVPVEGPSAGCVAEMPHFYEDVPFSQFMVLP